MSNDSNIHSPEVEKRWQQALRDGRYLEDGKYGGFPGELRPGMKPEPKPAASQRVRDAIEVAAVLAVVVVGFLALVYFGVI